MTDCRGIPQLGGNSRQSQGTGMGLGGNTHEPMVGSNAIQAQGMLKEQYVSLLPQLVTDHLIPFFIYCYLPRELKAFKMQSQELGEAERLEREALKLRENAVAHGMFCGSILHSTSRFLIRS